MYELKQLEDVLEIIMGQAPKSEECNIEGKGTVFVKAGEFGDIVPIIKEWTTNPLKISKKEDVLICVVGATVGKLNLGIDAAIGRSVAALRSDKNKLNYKYLYYYLKTWVIRLRETSQGSAIGVITKDMLNKIEIPIPCLTEQAKIVEVLDKAQELIDKRKEQIEALDELVKSRFIEMFGTIKTTKYPICKMHEIASIKHGYAFKGEYFSEVDNGIVLVTPGNFKIGGGFQEEKCKFFTSEYSNEYVLKAGDLIVTMTDLSKKADTLGYGAIVPETNRTYLHNQRIGLFEKISSNLNRVYLCYFMQSVEYRGNIVATSTGSTVHHTSPSKILDSNVILPPIELQNQFAGFVNQVDKLKSQREVSLKELEDNFNSLMQKAFKGELF